MTTDRQPTAVGLQPIAGDDRVIALDALRGLAILGILVVNVQQFIAPAAWLQLAGEQVWQGADRVAYGLTAVFAQGKFLSTFAMLFGVGVAIQLGRAERRGSAPTGLLARRMAVLAVFGLVHGVLVWYGDILFTYALSGFVLLGFRRQSPRTLLAWGAGLIAAVTAVLLLSAALTALPGAGEAAADAQRPLQERASTLADDAARAYTSGDYAAMVGVRLREFGWSLMNVWLIIPWTAGLMLVGMAVGRAGVHERLADVHTRARLRRAAVVSVVVGLPLNVAMAAALLADPSGVSAVGQLASALQLGAAPILAVGYVAAGALLWSATRDARPTRALAAVGRMALTNYLAQSVIATGIFYGLARYGSTSLLTGLAVGTAIFAAQLVWSPLWLSRFRRGPMEWLWRRLTYGPLRPAGADAAPRSSGGPTDVGPPSG